MMGKSRRLRRGKRKERARVTVCLAAICNDSKTVIGASDRMMTAGDVQFEPPQSKIWQLTSSIVAMYSGDTSVLTGILRAVAIEANAHVREHPNMWLRVEAVAEIYRRCYWLAHVKGAEDKVLSPLGLTAPSFLGAQGTMDQDVVADLTAQMQEWSFPDLNSVIIAGVDVDGPQGPPGTEHITYAHIYVAHNGEVACHDRVGFAAIGIGTSHAESQFMYSQHNVRETFRDTILLTFLAKKRAEVAPGVGEDTDMFMIGPGLGSYTTIGDHVLDALTAIHQEYQVQLTSAMEEASSKMHQFDEEIKDRIAKMTKEAQSSTQSDAQKSAGQR